MAVSFAKPECQCLRRGRSVPSNVCQQLRAALPHRTCWRLAKRLLMDAFPTAVNATVGKIGRWIPGRRVGLPQHEDRGAGQPEEPPRYSLTLNKRAVRAGRHHPFHYGDARVACWVASAEQFESCDRLDCRLLRIAAGVVARRSREPPPADGVVAEQPMG